MRFELAMDRELHTRTVYTAIDMLSDVGGAYNVASLAGALATWVLLSQFGDDVMVSKLFKKQNEQGKAGKKSLISNKFTENSAKFVNNDLNAIKNVMMGKESMKKKSTCGSFCSKCRVCC